MKTILSIDAGSRTTALLLALPDTKPTEWPRGVFSAGNPLRDASRFLIEGKFPSPTLTLLCSMGNHPEPSPADSLRMKRWEDEIRSSGFLPERLLRESLPNWEVELLLEEASRTFGTTLCADSAAAACMAALSLRAVRDRCWHEGITLVYAGFSHVQVFMVYRDRLWGLYEDHSMLPPQRLQRYLSQMRLNWLLSTEVQANGGHGCICGDLPADGEGFRPTYIFGPAGERFAMCGRIIHPCKNSAYIRCFGLIEALKRRNVA